MRIEASGWSGSGRDHERTSIVASTELASRAWAADAPATSIKVDAARRMGFEFFSILLD
jgi:hypothetical protein